MEQPQASVRLQRLIQRREESAIAGKRNLYMSNPLHGIYQWSKGSAAFAPDSGPLAQQWTHRISLGDHNCKVAAGKPFPYANEMPSKKNGYKHTPLNWAYDYAFFLSKSPVPIYPDEKIVGEFYWQLDEARPQKYPEELDAMGERAMRLGAGGTNQSHCCPDLTVGLELGWSGILNKVRSNRKRFRNDPEKSEYLQAQEISCLAIMDYISKYADAAAELGDRELEIVCRNVGKKPPTTLREALQWIQFYQVVERIIAHGNGYGRLDLMLTPYYEADRNAGRISRKEAIELIAELYLKYGGNYFSFSGRNADGSDATNELSWICLEAYDMIGGYNCMSVMWHSNINPTYYRYACEVVYRHKCATPALINYDKTVESEILSGVKKEDAWNVTYSGCQWYCVIGKEYCDQDKNVVVIIQCLLQTVKQCSAMKNPPDSYRDFYAMFLENVDIAASALLDLKNAEYRYQSKVWPEIATSLITRASLERALDITAIGTGEYNYSSINILGIVNAIDSLRAIQEVVFKEKYVDFVKLQEALYSDFKGFEVLREKLLAIPKFGSDDLASNKVAREMTNDIAAIFNKKVNCKGYPFRGSLFHFQGHSFAGPYFGASPDGRHAEETFAQGINPQHGRGPFLITQVGNALLSFEQERFIGAPWQCELDASFFRNTSDPGELLDTLSCNYFNAGGMHINFNITTLAELEDAQVNPEKHQNLVVKVTGYSAHFIQLSSEYQNDIIHRNRIVS